jgi:hypothetical protein
MIIRRIMPEQITPADRTETALDFLVMVYSDFLLAAQKFHIFFRSGINRQHRPRVHSAAVVTVTSVNEIAVFLNNYFYRAADAMPVNIVHYFSRLSLL